MRVACRLAGLFALEAHYAGLVALTQTGHAAVCAERQRIERPHEPVRSDDPSSRWFPSGRPVS